MNYDYIIIGAGPTGLTSAWILAQYNKKVLIIDREDTIGGCHRVRRVDNYFTEHGPRIYSTAYLNTIKLLTSMDLNFDNYFVPYKFNFINIGGKQIENLKFRELFWLGVEFIRLIFDTEYSKGITCLEFMNKHNFSEETKDYIDRVCRFTDGAESSRYTLFEFLQLANTNAPYQILQPELPNDMGLLKDMKEKLQKTGNVHFMTGTKIIKLIGKNNKISDIILSKSKKESKMSVNNIILAIPPFNLLEILGNSDKQVKNAFGNYNLLRKWTLRNRYMPYISIIYHWNKKLDLPKVWGFPKSDWGVAFIVLTDYMDFKGDKSKTVITSLISIFDKPVKIGNQYKVPDQCSEQELLDETLRQLKMSYPTLEEPTMAMLSPGVYKDENIGRWICIDDAYMMTTDIVKGNPIKLQSDKYSNLYSAGPHSGYEKYYFTSMESAITNAFALCHNIVPESKRKYVIKGPMTIIDYIKLVVLVIILLIIIWKIR